MDKLVGDVVVGENVSLETIQPVKKNVNGSTTVNSENFDDTIMPDMDPESSK